MVPEQTLPGVKKIELIRHLRTRWELYLMFGGLILMNWGTGWETFMVNSVTTRVASVFDKMNLVSVISTVSSILKSVLFPIFSRLSDLVGRNEIYSFSFVFHVISFVILATAQNFDAIVGGRVVSTIGEVGLTIMGFTLVGDMTTTMNRGFYHGLLQFPLLINYFVSPIVAQELAEKQNKWRWAFGHLPLVLLVCEVPFLFIAWKVQARVHKSSQWLEYKQERAEQKRLEGDHGFLGTLKRYLITIDIVGSTLMVGALTMTLLPLILARSEWGGWQTATTLGTLCGGIVAWILLAIWEWKFATQPLVPMHRWSNRTPIYGAIAMAWVTLVASINWMYFHSFLQVTRRATITRSTYIRNGYRVAYTFVQPFIGLLMMRTKKWRPYLWGGMVLFILGVGLMIPARQPSESDAFVVITQILAGAGAGAMDNVIITAVQSSVPHNDLAMVTALFQFTGSIGGSIGSTIAGAIWNQILPDELAKNVPGDFSLQRAAGNYMYVWGLPENQFDAVVLSYGNAQKILSIVSICLCVISIGFLVPLRSFGLDKPEEQNEDNLTEIKHGDESSIENSPSIANEKHSETASGKP